MPGCTGSGWGGMPPGWGLLGAGLCPLPARRVAAPAAWRVGWALVPRGSQRARGRSVEDLGVWGQVQALGFLSVAEALGPTEGASRRSWPSLLL